MKLSTQLRLFYLAGITACFPLLQGCGGAKANPSPTLPAPSESLAEFTFGSEAITIADTEPPEHVKKKIDDLGISQKDLAKAKYLAIQYESTNLPQLSLLLISKNRNSSMVVYNHGHDGLPVAGQAWAIDFINLLLARGYSVLLTSMPLVGLNEPIKNQRYWLDPVGGTSRTEIAQDFVETWPTYHQIYQGIKTSGSFMHFFVDSPALVPHALSNAQHPNLTVKISNAEYFERIHYVGLSGGGFSGLIACGLFKFKSCTLVAGFLPFEFKFAAINDWGDSEQWAEGFFTNYSYEHLMVLAEAKSANVSYIYNSGDDCCFADPSASNFKYAYPKHNIIVLNRSSHSFEPGYVFDLIDRADKL
jgi:hypothetical protein